MDPSSIITQVSAPSPHSPQSSSPCLPSSSSSSDPAASSSAHLASSANPSQPHDATDPGGGGRGGSSASSSSSQNQQNTQIFSASSKESSRKKSSSSFLCFLNCCLGKKKSLSSREKDSNSSSGVGSGSVGTAGGEGGRENGGTATGQGGSNSATGGVKGGKPLLGEKRTEDANKKCIVIDLDETLVHSSFKPINNADFIVPVEIDGTIHQVYVLKRPHVDEFLVRMGELFECVLFTASLAKYADPVTDLLDKWDVFHSRLFRESCVFHRGNYVKDLGRLGRDLHKILIVDNSPASYIFHPDNAVPVASWFDDMNDRELLDLIPFMESVSREDNIFGVLQALRNKSAADQAAAASNK